MMFFTEELSSRADEAWEDEENARQLTAEVSRSKWIYPMDLVQRDFTADRPNRLEIAPRRGLRLAPLIFGVC
jgi:hypothetical protein